MARDIQRAVFEEVETLRREGHPIITTMYGEVVDYTAWEQRLEGAD